MGISLARVEPSWVYRKYETHLFAQPAERAPVRGNNSHCLAGRLAPSGELSRWGPRTNNDSRSFFSDVLCAVHWSGRLAGPPGVHCPQVRANTRAGFPNGFSIILSERHGLWGESVGRERFGLRRLDAAFFLFSDMLPRQRKRRLCRVQAMQRKKAASSRRNPR